MNKSLKEKSAARLAAVQLLYQAAITGGKASAEYLPEADGKDDVKPNATLLKKLLDGVSAHAAEIEPWVEKTPTAEWKKERMSPLMLAIFRLAVFELAHFSDTKPAIIINEYVTLTGRFFGEAETGFVNAALQSIAAELRG